MVSQAQASDQGEISPLLVNADWSLLDLSVEDLSALTDPPTLTPWWKQPSILWLLPAFFMVSVSSGGNVVPKLNLILSLVCNEYLAQDGQITTSQVVSSALSNIDNPKCRDPEVQSRAATFVLYTAVTTGIMCAIMSPRLGTWSDRYGRLRLLALSSVGLLLSEIVNILASLLPDQVNYRWLLLGAFLDGLFGSFTAVMSITFAYASDVTSSERRAQSFSYFHACLFAGMAIGPLVAAFILETTGKVVYLFYLSTAGHTCFTLYVFFVVPESLTPKRQRIARGQFASARNLDGRQLKTVRTYFEMASSLFEPLRILWPTESGTSAHLRSNLSLLATVDTISLGMTMGAMSVLVYYLGFAFSWSSAESSLFMSIISIGRVTGLLVLLPLLNCCLGRRERRLLTLPQQQAGASRSELTIIRYALFIEIVGVAGYALSPNGGFFVLSGILASMGGICSPTVQSALTKHVPPERTGQLLGATGLLHSLARIVAPAATNFVYARSVSSIPWLVFAIMSVCYALAWSASLNVRPNVKYKSFGMPHSTSIDSTLPNPAAEAQLDDEVAPVR